MCLIYSFEQTAPEYILQDVGHNNIFQKVIVMKSKKLKKKQEEPNHENIPKKEDQELTHKITFNISTDNLACFIGQKKHHKNKTRKSSNSPQKNKKHSLPAKQTIRKSPLKIEERISRIKSELQQIVQGTSNAILYQIQDKGLKCAWGEQPEEKAICSDESDPSESIRLWSIFPVKKSHNESFQKSYASTIDVHPHVNNYYIQSSFSTQNYYYDYSYRPYQEGGYYIVEANSISTDPRTTVMIRNIPNKYTIKELAEQIDLILPNTYDFLYLPCDVKNQCNVGYGFINFISNQYLLNFYYEFQDKRWAKFKSQKICNITYARLQGLDSLIQHFQNSKVQKDKKYRPIIRQFTSIDHLVRTQQLN